MDRRTFLRLSSAMGLGLCGLPRSARATVGQHPGPFWVFISAQGGWDPTMFCDPRGREIEVKEGVPVNQTYSWYDRVDLGIPGSPAYFAPETVAPWYSPFLSAWGSEVRILNGVDHRTNAHRTGRQVAGGGSFDVYPAMAALLAAHHGAGQELAMPFISFGNYSETDDLVVRSRLDSVDALSRITAPNEAALGLPFHTSAAATIIEQAAARRLARARAALPRRQRALDDLRAARVGSESLERLSAYLPLEEMEDLTGFQQQAYLATAAFKAGLSVSAVLEQNGFDSHVDSDIDQPETQRKLFEGFTTLLERAEALGIADQLNVVLSSDFGRTPYYNERNGKDHWAVGSWVFLLRQAAPTSRLIVRGQSELATFRGHPVHPETLEVLPVGDPAGQTITAEHIHAALRDVAGLAGTPYDTAYPLEVPTMPLFS